MTRTTKPARGRHQSDPGGPSLEGLGGVVVAGTAGYLSAEGLLGRDAHPIHWLVAGLVGFAGYWAGEGLRRWRER